MACPFPGMDPFIEGQRWKDFHTTLITMPVIPVPLAGDDPDVPLDLQAAFARSCDRAGYDYALDYRRPPQPSLNPSTAEWVRSLLEC